MALAGAGNAWATNGMNMEAYGARAGGMGGAAMAYDSGNSAVMNNPATLALMPEGVDRLGVGLTILGPDVSSKVKGTNIASDSDGTAYYMPSVSYMRKRGPFTYGAAVLAQGGMGTEYGRADDPTDLFFGGFSMMGNETMLSGQEIRSEVGVGRLMFPVAYQATDRLSVAGQLDVVWATMDLQMDLSGAQFGDLANPASHQYGEASGSMVDGFMSMLGTSIQDVNWARFDFSNGNDFTGEAVGAGLGAKLGLVYRVNDRFSIGAAYHSETKISDLKTDNATLSFNADFGEGGVQTVPVSGEVRVKDFQWPATYAIGAAFKVNDRLMLVADVTRINWSETMSDFRMVFTADNSAANGPFAGTKLDSTLYQDWEDQTVLAVGGQYKVTPKLTVRLGVNIADNPVPDAYMNPLFPAIEKTHYTAGFGYAISKSSQVGMAVAYAPEVEQTADSGVTSTHSQFNWRFNYVYQW